MRYKKIIRELPGGNLIIKHRKSAVIFELPNELTAEVTTEYKFNFVFTRVELEMFYTHLCTLANEAWKDLEPKEATSFGADYTEYYSRKLDNNGYLNIVANGLVIERPSLESLELYQFNKKKMESFLYHLDLIK